MRDQLTLGISLKDEASFDSFYVGHNSQLIASLQHALLQKTGEYLYLWGASGDGKSHLLHACSQLITNFSGTSFYLSLKQAADLAPALLDNIAHYSLVVIDDIDYITKNSEWETSLFHLFNHCMQTKAHLLISASCSPMGLSLALPDLQSRVMQGLVYQIKPLDDDQKLAALQRRAQIRGMVLTDEVGRYLLTRYAREMHHLFGCLEILDKASLVMQHRLTIPFVKSALAEQT